METEQYGTFRYEPPDDVVEPMTKIGPASSGYYLCTYSVYHLNPRLIRPPTAQLSQSMVPRSLVTSLVSYPRLGESDAPSPYYLGLIDPGDISPVNATQETLFFAFYTVLHSYPRDFHLPRPSVAAARPDEPHRRLRDCSTAASWQETRILTTRGAPEYLPCQAVELPNRTRLSAEFRLSTVTAIVPSGYTTIWSDFQAPRGCAPVRLQVSWVRSDLCLLA
ncbi:hypothetical protein BDP55DRAFT_33069 [Colletotrichum godetiae]|uniref:Uncharacterized protein n=1 Tax=Colletotrichum godetiae TaxID=1209918 RepID=A0AAJ0AR69_9PEZI|nr:uncharacterized protein BDP55DRAFT_33069 [Colletotrichum godetiae]KAK1688874.1 hypothetical protein BDP55DRAFT_33069 [Colletotrichum godetiae]